MEEKKLTNKEILQIIREVITREDNLDENYIDLYEILCVYDKKNKECCKLISAVNEKLEGRFLNLNFDEQAVDSIEISSNAFDYKTGNLVIDLLYDDNEWDKLVIRYNKEEDDLELSRKSFRKFSTSPFYYAACELQDLYFFYLDNYDYMKNKKFKLSQNDMLIEIENSEIYLMIGDFILNALLKDDEFDYGFSMNSCNIVQIFGEKLGDENTKKFLHGIYLKIEDCPKWCQSELQRIRKEQLTKDKNKTMSKSNHFWSRVMRKS